MKGVKRLTLIVFFFILLSFIPVYGEKYFNDSFDDAQSGFSLVTTNCHSGNCIKQYDTDSTATFAQLIDFGSVMNNSHKPVSFYIYSTDYTDGADNIDFHIGFFPDITPDLATESSVWITIREGEIGCYATDFTGSGVTLNTSDWYLLNIYPDYTTHTYNYTLRNEENSTTIASQTNCDFRNNVANSRYIYYWYKDNFVTDGLYADELIIGDATTGGGGGSTPSITLSTNLTTDKYTTNLTFNVTGTAVNITANSFNCSLYLNSSLNDTLLNVPLNNTYQIFNLTYGSQQVGYDVNVTCERWDYGLHVVNSVLVTDVFIDTIPPELDISSGFSNNSILFRHIDILDFNVTFNDTNLYAVNLSIFKLNADGSINMTMNNTFQENVNTTGYNLNYSANRSIDFTNLTDWTDGKYKIVGEAWDDHTKKAIKNYKLKKLTNGYEIEDKIKITSPSLKSMSLVKKKDRYSFAMEFLVSNPDIYVESTGKLIYLPNSKYKGHLVDFENKKWIDFEESYDNVDVIKINNNKYKIVPKSNKKVFEFNSIGDLNYNSKAWFFNISEGFTFYAINNITGGQINNFTINVLNGTNLVQSKNTTIGNITFNITSGVYTTNITASGYANNNTGNLTFSAGGNYTYQMFAENSLFLFFYKEENGELIDDRNVTVKVINLANTSKEVVTDTGSAFISGFAPGDYEIIFNASGYMHNQYFTTITSSSTQTIDLYLVNNATGSLIVFNWADEKGRPITNAIMQRLRLVRISDNAYIVTGMSRTDDNGETSMNLEPNTVFYRFRLQDENGNIVYSGNSQQIFSNLVFFRVELIPDTFQSYSLVHGGKVTSLPIDWDNTTHIVSFTYSDTTGTTVRGCIRVIERTIFNENIYENCVNSSSATVQLNMSAHINNKSQYIAQGYIDTGTLYSQPTLQMMSISFGKNYQIFGNSGLFIAYLFIASMFLIGSTVSFSISVVFTVLSLLVTQMIGVSFFGWTLIVGIGFAGLFIAVVIKN